MITLEDVVSYFTNPTAIGYTPEKTLILASILVVIVYVIFEVLKKLKIKIDRRLAIGIIPYVILASTLRVLQDAKVFNTIWLITPGIYGTMITVILSILIVSFLIERKFSVPYFKTLFVVGLLGIAFFLPLLNFINTEGFLLVSAFYLPWVIIFYKIRWTLANKLVTLAQMFDANATFVALQFFGYYEQHVVPSFFINIFSPVSFIFLKVVAIAVILVLIDRSKGDREFNNFLKLMIGILGLATGTRDFLRLLALT